MDVREAQDDRNRPTLGSRPVIDQTRPTLGSRPVTDEGDSREAASATAERVRRRRWPRRRQRFGLAAAQPAAALAGIAALMVAGIVIANPIQVAVVLGFVLLVLVLSRRLRAAWPYLKFGLYITVFLFVINPLVSQAGLDVLWEADLGPLRIVISIQGIYFAVGMAIRLVAVVAAFALYTTLLDQDEQLAIMSSVSFRSGLVVSLATRMFPVLSRDATRISDAQRARGVELDRGGWRQRAVRRLPLLGALISRSLERATDIAESMEARGYGRAGRRSWRTGRRWLPGDVFIVVTALGSIAAILWGLGHGIASFDYFPLTDDPFPDLTDPTWIATAALLAVATLVLPGAMDVRRAVRHRAHEAALTRTAADRLALQPEVT